MQGIEGEKQDEIAKYSQFLLVALVRKWRDRRQRNIAFDDSPRQML